MDEPTTARKFDPATARALLLGADIRWPDADTRLAPTFVAELLLAIEAEARASQPLTLDVERLARALHEGGWVEGGCTLSTTDADGTRVTTARDCKHAARHSSEAEDIIERLSRT